VYEEDDAVIGCIFALCKISGSKKEIYINEMAVFSDMVFMDIRLILWRR